MFRILAGSLVVLLALGWFAGDQRQERIQAEDELLIKKAELEDVQSQLADLKQQNEDAASHLDRLEEMIRQLGGEPPQRQSRTTSNPRPSPTPQSSPSPRPTREPEPQPSPQPTVSPTPCQVDNPLDGCVVP